VGRVKEMFEIMVEDTFSSAHQLVGYEGPCENLHGHTWKVQMFLKGGRLGKQGMLLDFKKAKAVLKKIISEFDHKNLNDIKVFKKINPTAENIAKTIYNLYLKSIVGANSSSPNIKITKVTVWESEATCATYSS
jgi:6-pyruvoyltetrahydropterin/6-carboxytetrahydropterin synthase